MQIPTKTSNFKNPNLTILLYFAAIVFLIPSCRIKRSSDYTAAMGQCGRIISAIDHYKKFYENIPSENQLIDFMKRHNYDPESINGWKFHDPDENYFARKNNITMESGRVIDLIITKDAEFLIYDSKTK